LKGRMAYWSSSDGFREKKGINRRKGEIEQRDRMSNELHGEERGESKTNYYTISPGASKKPRRENGRYRSCFKHEVTVRKKGKNGWRPFRGTK